MLISIAAEAPYRLPEVQQVIAAALAEDLDQDGDCTCRCLVPPQARLEAVLTAKSAGTLCGLSLFTQVCQAIAPGSVEVGWAMEDGTVVQAGTVVLRAAGVASTLLQAERTALNLMQRLSGVSTTTAAYVRAVAGTRAGIYDTRKTTPGLRRLEKWAVRCGGGCNHRMGLFDQVLIKENHIALMGPGGPPEAVRRCRTALGPLAMIEVEIERVEDLAGVIEAGADIVLVDNCPPAELARAVAIRGQRATRLEASGGITLANVRAYAETGVDRISIGALTHSVAAFDLSLRCHLPGDPLP